MSITTTDPRAAFRCPDWCVTSLESHADDDPGHALHGSKTFGRVQFWQTTGEPITADLTTNDDMSVDDLRQLAADALAAAEWLEAQS